MAGLISPPSSQQPVLGSWSMEQQHSSYRSHNPEAGSWGCLLQGQWAGVGGCVPLPLFPFLMQVPQWAVRASRKIGQWAFFNWGPMVKGEQGSQPRVHEHVACWQPPGTMNRTLPSMSPTSATGARPKCGGHISP